VEESTAVDGPCLSCEGLPALLDRAAGTYDACFGLGHHYLLHDRPGTFRVSQAGTALGAYLADHLTARDLGGRVLEIGTGSGAIALLLRSLGATRITATDISASAVLTAKQNEIENFGGCTIEFSCADLFPVTGHEERVLYDLIVFNPPGWRGPSPLLKAELDQKKRSLDLEAMFYGDQVVLRFLERLPEHLADGGRVILGLNSLIGIADVIERAQTRRWPSGSLLKARLLERVEFPLFLYTEEWLEVRSSLLLEFERAREEFAASYVTRGETIHWFYEITEVTVQRLSGPSCPTQGR
jgi:release factor glutamine methyltransferase